MFFLTKKFLKEPTRNIVYKAGGIGVADIQDKQFTSFFKFLFSNYGHCKPYPNKTGMFKNLWGYIMTGKGLERKEKRTQKHKTKTHVKNNNKKVKKKTQRQKAKTKHKGKKTKQEKKHKNEVLMK